VRNEELGKIDISINTINTIVAQAIHQCYGVVGMASKSRVDGLARLLSRDSKPGIDVKVEADEISVDVYVIMQYGVRIRTVAETIQSTVKFSLENVLSLNVKAVNVYVQGLQEEKES